MMRISVKWAPDVVGMEEYPLTKIHLNERAKNALCRAKIFTLGQLMEKWDSLGEIKNLGALTVKEIHAAVFATLCDLGSVTLGINLQPEREAAEG